MPELPENYTRWHQGMSPDVTGCILNEPNDAYHGNAAISNSKLSDFVEAPLRYKGKFVTKDIEPERKTCFDFGDLFHVLALEGIDTYQQRFIYEALCPDKPTSQERKAHEEFGIILKPTSAQEKAQERREKKIQTYETFWNVHAGKTPIKADNDKIARAMRDAVWANPDARKLLESGVSEVTFRTPKVERFGFQLQCKGDRVNFAEQSFVDLKTVRDLNLFEKQFCNFGYYRQAAFYKLVTDAVMGDGWLKSFRFIAVEKTAPYECAVFQADPTDLIEVALPEIVEGLDRLSLALRTGEFEHRFPGVKTISLPDWKKDKIHEGINDRNMTEPQYHEDYGSDDTENEDEEVA